MQIKNAKWIRLALKLIPPSKRKIFWNVYKKYINNDKPLYEECPII